MNSKQIAVHTCGDCPLHSYQDEMMYHSCGLNDNIDMPTFPNDKWIDKRVHDKCPLKNENITITLNENN